MAETITTGMENLMVMKMVVLVMLITPAKGKSLSIVRSTDDRLLYGFDLPMVSVGGPLSHTDLSNSQEKVNQRPVPAYHFCVKAHK